jgi:cellulose biosynthesis protein BcsQ
MLYTWGMKSIVFFNNKGGVGKTSLLCNVAAHFANALSQRVLVIDCDPQCNATQLVLKPDVCQALYDKRSHDHTLRTVLEPLQEGESAIEHGFQPFEPKSNRFGVHILPGHPRVSLIEDRLGEAWTQSAGGDIGGLRKTNWCYSMLNHVRSEYDVIFLDVGPSLGSLNRSVLLGADYFVTPMGCDIFSILGIRNIGAWLKAWFKVYERGVGRAKEESAEALGKYAVRERPGVSDGFVGYTVQQYITKSRGGQRRATEAFERILRNIPAEIQKSLHMYSPANNDFPDAKLGDVPNMFSLVPLAQSVNAPIAALTGSDGLVGSQYKQAEQYASIIEGVAGTLAKNVGAE